MQQRKRWGNTGRKMLIFIVGLFVLAYISIAYLFLDVAIRGEKKGVDLHQYALNVYLVNEAIDSNRGTIYDKAGTPLAVQLTSYTLYANLYEDYGDMVTDIDETAEKLSTAINLSAEEIKERLSKENARQVEFGNAGKNLTYLEKEKIELLGLSGLKFREDVRRLYPNGVFASHTLGYTRYDESSRLLVGDMGLESYLNEELSGENGRVQYLKDRYGYIQPNQEPHVITPVKHGLDFYLTIDATIQTFLEEAMDKVEKDVDPESLVAIVANPKTGEIIAMGSRDSFDPNLRDITNYNNPLISQPFEPGSTMKIYTYAAAINENKYSGSMLYQSGSRLFNTATIRDYDQSWGAIDYDEGFYRSSNTAIVDILSHMTPDTNLDYFEAFGFGDSVGLPLPNEYSGTMPSDKDVTQKMTAGFGQGIMTTPIQHIQAITAILNEGQLIKPQLIDSVYDPNKDEYVYTLQPHLLNQPVTKSTAEQVKQLMIGVVEDETGSGKAYELEHFTSGGKTGTAQIADPGKGYLSDEYVYSYIGFAPADDPELVMYVAMDRPKSKSGHAVLGELYRYVMDNGLSYLGATKTPIIENEAGQTVVEVDNYLNMSTEKAIEQAKLQGLEPIVLGEGARVFAQSPTKGQVILEGQKLFLKTDDQFALPDFTNYSKNDMVLFSSLTNMKVDMSGVGYVISQSIQPNKLVTEADVLKLTLDPNGKEVKLPEDTEDIEEQTQSVDESSR